MLRGCAKWSPVRRIKYLNPVGLNIKYFISLFSFLLVYFEIIAYHFLLGRFDHLTSNLSFLKFPEASSKADLEQIPAMFLQPTFTLENPDTFNAVFPWSRCEWNSPGQKGKIKQSSKLLQEKVGVTMALFIVPAS